MLTRSTHVNVRRVAQANEWRTITNAVTVQITKGLPGPSYYIEMRTQQLGKEGKEEARGLQASRVINIAMSVAQPGGRVQGGPYVMVLVPSYLTFRPEAPRHPYLVT